ncbi:MAG: hypothetical protein CRN43_10695, partial [Candidatus Nephrothrix sp. EaCA]
ITNLNADGSICHQPSETTRQWQHIIAQFSNSSKAYNGAPAADVSGSIISWRWNFGEASGFVSSTTAQPAPPLSHDYSLRAGRHSVTWEATGRGGCTASETKEVIAGDTLAPRFINLENGIEFCGEDLAGSGKLVALNISSGRNEYKIKNTNVDDLNDTWVSLGNSSTFKLKKVPQAGDSHDFDYSEHLNRPAYITYKNTESLSKCSASKRIVIAAYKPPIAEFNFVSTAGINSVCRPLGLDDLQAVQVQFNNTTLGYDGARATATTVTRWEWNFGTASGGASADESPSYAYTEVGSYQVSLKAVGRGGCIVSAIRHLKVGNTPNPRFTGLPQEAELCRDDLKKLGKEITLHTPTGSVNEYKVGNRDYISIGNRSSFFLKDADTLGSSSTPLPYYFNYSDFINTATANSTYNEPAFVQLTYKNTDQFSNCSASASIAIKVYDPPQADFTSNANGNNALCRLLNSAGALQSVRGIYTNATKGWDGWGVNTARTINSWKWSFGVPSAVGNENRRTWNGEYDYNRSDTYSISLEVIGKGDCKRSVVKNIIIGDTPNPKFLTERNHFCADELTLERNNSGGVELKLNLTTGANYYSVNGEPFVNIAHLDAVRLINSVPRIARGSDYDYRALIGIPTVIEYKNVELLGQCNNTTSKTVTVFRLPTVNFSVTEKREPKTYHCLKAAGDQGTNFKLEAPPDSPNYMATLEDYVHWNFGDGTSKRGLKSDTANHIYAEAGIYNVKLSIKNKDNCENSHTVVFPVAYQPIADFHASKLCAGEGTELKFTTDLPLRDSLITKASYRFNFGNGFSERYSLKGTTWPGKTIVHPAYFAPGKYTATLTVTDSIANGASHYSCRSNTKSKTVGIVPQVPGRNYSEHFDLNDGQWAAQGWTNHGEFGTSWNHGVQRSLDESKYWLASSSSDGIWSTRKDKKYEPSQRSALYSPCFDLRAQGYYPVMSFDYFTQLPDQQDGVCLEYSYDGSTWKQVKNDTSGYGRNWYDSRSGSVSGLAKRNLPDGPYGPETDQFGWTGKSHGWLTAKYDLSNPLYKKKIRFRFLFGTNDDSKIPGDNGFALNNFSIYQRNTTALGEHFLSKDNTDPEEFFEFRKTDTLFIKLSYPTARGNSDDLEYLSNTADPDARATYYGVASPPWSFINGINEYKHEEGKKDRMRISLWGTKVFSDKILESSPIEITDIKAELKGEKLLTITPKLHALTQIPRGNWVVHTVLTEEINGRKIMRKFLPHAAGTPLTASEARHGIPARDQEFSYEYRWDKGNHIKDVSKAGVIVFVQNLDTKLVMQASYKSLKNMPPPTITGFENYSNEASLYPNPAKTHFYFEAPFAKVTGMSVYNMAGQAIEVPYTLSGRRIKADISALSEGIYIVEVRSENGIAQKKLTK